jgi:hypothetical protein
VRPNRSRKKSVPMSAANTTLVSRRAATAAREARRWAHNVIPYARRRGGQPRGLSLQAIGAGLSLPAPRSRTQTRRTVQDEQPRHIGARDPADVDQGEDGAGRLASVWQAHSRRRASPRQPARPRRRVVARWEPERGAPVIEGSFPRWASSRPCRYGALRSFIPSGTGPSRSRRPSDAGAAWSQASSPWLSVAGGRERNPRRKHMLPESRQADPGVPGPNARHPHVETGVYTFWPFAAPYRRGGEKSLRVGAPTRR